MGAVESLKQIARTIFDQALSDCSIDRTFGRFLRTVASPQGTRLILGGEDFIALDHLERVCILSVGKASVAMFDSLRSRLSLPQSCDLRGVLIAAERPRQLPPAIQFFPGGHPLPNHASFAGAAAALSMLHALSHPSASNSLCIFLISGGASAMMELPLDPSISLEDTIAFHRVLVHSGASIVEINCVRKHFSAVKGGRLSLAAGHARKLSLFVSDVPPAHLDALASGPTVPDPTTVAECREILARYKLLPQFPASVRRFFLSPDLPETPTTGDAASQCLKLLDSDSLASAAQSHAATLGFHSVVDNTCDDWSYDAAADYLLNRLRQLRQTHSRVCLISTGEVAVRVPDVFTVSASRATGSLESAPHVGGRNQHFALYLATRLQPSDGPLAILSAGSDGIDGNSSAAGAVIDEHTLDQEKAHPFAPGSSHLSQISCQAAARRALEAFDASSFLHSLGATVVTGPTGHNLRDLRILLSS